MSPIPVKTTSVLAVALSLGLISVSLGLAQSLNSNHSEDYQQYLDYFEEVYAKMQKNYYVPVQREDFDRFIQIFNDKIYSELASEGKSVNYVKWRSASNLVKFLKQEEDSFSKLLPPKVAEEYEQTVLGIRINLGIEGKLMDKGYLITKLEPRSDPYLKGIRINDIILRIDGKKVIKMSEEKILELLTPEEGVSTKIVYFDVSEQKEKTAEAVSKEYFNQTVFLEPVKVPNVYCLRIQKFNRKTSEDMFNYLKYIHGQAGANDPALILDLRGNPGGPPLAAREISSFFLTPEEDFAYFKKRDNPKALLKVPEIPEKYRFTGDIVILIDEESGSASELFSGVMKFRDRAFVMGVNSAGKVFLKSMFYLNDESMLLLVTGRGHYPDGSVFPFDGVAPDRYVTAEKQPDLVHYAATFLAYKRQLRN